MGNGIGMGLIMGMGMGIGMGLESGARGLASRDRAIRSDCSVRPSVVRVDRQTDDVHVHSFEFLCTTSYGRTIAPPPHAHRWISRQNAIFRCAFSIFVRIAIVASASNPLIDQLRTMRQTLSACPFYGEN